MMEFVEKQRVKKVLAMDTSTSIMTIAILDGIQLLGQSSQSVERDHSNKLLPAIELLLTSLDETLSTLDGIAVGQGPGSYTGVRIGVTAAKTFAWSMDIPIIGVSSLAALAYGTRKIHNKRTTWYLPMLDARRNQVYTGLYSYSFRETSSWSVLAEDRILLLDSWLDIIVDKYQQTPIEDQPDEIICIIEGFETSKLDKLFNSLGNVKLVDHKMEALDIGLLAQHRFMLGERDEVHSLIPNYTQLSEAETNLLAKHK